eukprot:COSAG06_NODE_14496_length_1151_cov_1.443916_3_plen_49_part_01
MHANLASMSFSALMVGPRHLALRVTLPAVRQKETAAVVIEFIHAVRLRF